MLLWSAEAGGAFTAGECGVEEFKVTSGLPCDIEDIRLTVKAELYIQWRTGSYGNRETKESLWCLLPTNKHY